MFLGNADPVENIGNPTIDCMILIEKDMIYQVWSALPCFLIVFEREKPKVNLKVWSQIMSEKDYIFVSKYLNVGFWDQQQQHEQQQQQ